jgi:hypothetical protein
MSKENKVSIALKPEDLKMMLDAVNTINNVLSPYLISLTPVERQALPKMSDGTLPFVQKSLAYAQANPGLIPVYIDVDDLKIDLKAVEILVQIFKPVEQLYFNLNDTMTLSGSGAYMASLAFFNSVKHAAKINIPGIQVIADDLETSFSGQGKIVASGGSPDG